MNQRACEAVGGQARDAIYQCQPRAAKFRENLARFAGVVVGIMRLAIGQVRNGERLPIREKILEARQPERLEIEQVTGVLLRRPFAFGLADQRFAEHAAQHLLQPRGSAEQAHTYVGVLLHRKGEVELAVKPCRDAGGSHAVLDSARRDWVQNFNPQGHQGKQGKILVAIPGFHPIDIFVGVLLQLFAA